MESQNRQNTSRNNDRNNTYPKAPQRTMVAAKRMPEDYIEQAERIVCERDFKISTSKIRRLLSLVTEIYNRENLRTDEKLTKESEAALAMARVRIAYECGRPDGASVKEFAEQTYLIEYLKGLNGSRKEFLKFHQYMEALVAYHKYYGGKEN